MDAVQTDEEMCPFKKRKLDESDMSFSEDQVDSFANFNNEESENIQILNGETNEHDLPQPHPVTNDDPDTANPDTQKDESDGKKIVIVQVFS